MDEFKAFSHVVVRLGFHMAESTRASDINAIVKRLVDKGEVVASPVRRGVSQRAVKRMSSVGDLSRMGSIMSMRTISSDDGRGVD